MPQLDAPTSDARPRVEPSRPHEFAMAKAALKVAAPALVPIVGIAWLARGTAGAWTAGLVTAVVVAMFAVTGFAHGKAARYGPTALMAVALGGMVVRLGSIGVLLIVLRPTDLLDAPTLAVVTPVVIFALLAYEVRFVSTRPESLQVDASARARTDREDRS